MFGEQVPTHCGVLHRLLVRTSQLLPSFLFPGAEQNLPFTFKVSLWSQLDMVTGFSYSELDVIRRVNWHFQNSLPGSTCSHFSSFLLDTATLGHMCLLRPPTSAEYWEGETKFLDSLGNRITETPWWKNTSHLLWVTSTSFIYICQSWLQSLTWLCHIFISRASELSKFLHCIKYILVYFSTTHLWLETGVVHIQGCREQTLQENRMFITCNENWALRSAILKNKTTAKMNCSIMSAPMWRVRGLLWVTREQRLLRRRCRGLMGWNNSNSSTSNAGDTGVPGHGQTKGTLAERPPQGPSPGNSTVRSMEPPATR